MVLVPADHPGVEIGRRHLPSGAAFPNGPIWGRDVFIPIDWVIGGEKLVGQGWRMLMECLAAGRSISLPSSAAAGAKSLLRNTSAYARIRKQFDLPIGKMEGLQEPLARLVENAYVIEARPGGDGGHGEPRREALSAVRDHEVPDHRAHAPLGQRRHGSAWRPRHLRWAQPTTCNRPIR